MTNDTVENDSNEPMTKKNKAIEEAMAAAFAHGKDVGYQAGVADEREKVREMMILKSISLCSMHQIYNKDCHICENAAVYLKDVLNYLSNTTN